MPPAIASWAVTALAAEGFAATIVYAAVYVAASYVIAVGAQKAFGRKNQSGLAGEFSGRMTTIKQPIVPRRLIFGRARVGGVIVFAHSTSVQDINTRGEAYVIPPAPHQVTTSYAVTTPIGVQLTTFVASGGENSGPDVIYETMTEVSSSPGAGQYSRSGSTYTFAAADAGKQVTITFQANTTKLTDVYLHLIVVLAAHEVQEIEAVYFDDELVPLDANGNVTSGRYAAWAQVHKHLGEENQLADVHMVAASDGAWTAADRLRGHAYLHVSLLGHSTVFANGVPNITAVIKGKKDIFDPRTGTTGYTDNAALCVANYIAMQGYGLGASLSDFDSAALIAAANVCDEDVALAGGGTENRYTCNGVIDTSSSHEENMNALLSAMGGRAVWSMGRWYLSAAAYVTPTVTLDESDARGNIRVMPIPSRREQFNAVKGVFAAEAANWQPADYPPITNATYQAQDGERIWRDLDLPFTTSAATAQRLAKIELERQRQGLTCIFPARLDALVLQAGDTVMVTNARFGWSAKAFEVVKWEFVAQDDDAGQQALGVDLTLREIASAVFDWNSGLETTYDLARNTNLPRPSVVAPPGGITVVEELYETREGGGVKTRVVLTVSPSTDGRAHQYQFEVLNTSGATGFQVVGTVRGERLELADMAAGIYDFRAKAISALGASSIYAQIRQEILGLGARPADVTGLTLQAVSQLVVLQWAQHPDLDVRRGGKILIRHSEVTTGALWENSYSIVEAVTGDQTVAVVPLKAGTYLVKAEDAVGNQSLNASAVVTRATSLLIFTAAASAIEDPTFAGTKTNCDAVSGVLQLTASTLIDSAGDVDALPSIDGEGPTSTSGTYVFANWIDMTTVSRVQLRMELSLITVQTSSLLDSRELTVDDWLDWDGSAAGGSGDCVIEVRETDDDPAAVAPVWGAWKRLVTADYFARGFEFRALLSVTDNAYNIYVSRLRVGAFTV